jgi:UMF1 family MFS transporter
LWFVRPEPDSVPLALVGVALATVGFEVATVFYNALLPELAPSSHIGRVSGWGWGLGYVGGIVCLVVLLFGFIQVAVPPFGLDKSIAEHVRIAGPFSALWIAVFAVPLFVFVPDRARTAVPLGQAAVQGVLQVVESVRSLRHHRAIAWYLLGQMIYTDGLNTLFAFGGIYAAGTFGMTLDEVVIFGIALNVTAGAGAFAFAWIDDWIGAKRTVAIGLAALMAISFSMLIIESKSLFWALGLLLGVFFGPVQAASRSLMARLASPEHRAQMFGLFALSGRVTSFVGPALLGWVTEVAHSQRAGMSTILLFFAAGLAILVTKVPEAR